MIYFADTSYYISALVPTEPHHAHASRLSEESNLQMVTTAYVLVELAAYFAKPPYRTLAVRFVDRLREAATVTVVPSETSLFNRGWQMYANHGDKSWSLTDCISFVVMRDRSIQCALATDHHFEQAGFEILLKEENR